MDFDLNDEQRMLARTVADFAAKESPLGRARAMRDDDIGWSPDIWKQMGELGWLSVPFPEEVGGFGGGFLEAALILEQLGRTLVPEPYVASVLLGGQALLKLGDAAQHERWLVPMIGAETSLALADMEPNSRYYPTALETTAKVESGSVRLDGQKIWVQNGHRADAILVPAQGADGPVVVVVPRGTDGLSVQPVQQIDGHRGAHLKLQGVTVSTDHVLGQGDVAAVLRQLRDYGAAAAVAEGVGIAQAMLDMTVEYLKTREQFDVKIGSFQALQHRAVDMFVEVQLLKSAAMASMVLADSDNELEREAAVATAKVQLGTGGLFVSRQAIQLHGGIGVTDEHDIGLYFKRLQVLNHLHGDADDHLRRFADREGFAA